MISRTASVAAGTVASGIKTVASGILITVALAVAAGPQVSGAPLSAKQSTKPSAVPAQAAPEPEAAKPHEAASRETAQNGHQVKVIFTPWTRYCAQGPAENSSKTGTKEVCFTAADGHLASGQKLIIALLIEPKDSNAKLLRVSVPLGVALVPGARIVIDGKDAMTVPYSVCLPKNGCMADYKADAGLISKLKNGQTLMVQAFDKGQPISFTLPLTGFAKAYDGPPSDPTALNEQSQSLPNVPQDHSNDHQALPDAK